MRVLSKSLPTNHGIIFFSQQCTSKYQNFLQSIVSHILFQITYIRYPAPPMQICSFIKMPSILSFFALLLNFGSQSSLLRFHLTQHHTACCTLFSCICLLLCSVHAVQCNAWRYCFLETDTIFLIWNQYFSIYLFRGVLCTRGTYMTLVWLFLVLMMVQNWRNNLLPRPDNTISDRYWPIL